MSQVPNSAAHFKHWLANESKITGPSLSGNIYSSDCPHLFSSTPVSEGLDPPAQPPLRLHVLAHLAQVQPVFGKFLVKGDLLRFTSFSFMNHHQSSIQYPLLFLRVELLDPFSPSLPRSWQSGKSPGLESDHLPCNPTCPIYQHCSLANNLIAFHWSPRCFVSKARLPLPTSQTCFHTQMKCWNHPIDAARATDFGAGILGKDAPFLPVQQTLVCTLPTASCLVFSRPARLHTQQTF